eukprot:CAMPEP_0115532424 /NCGR_PEP_ID=MMETSP0271-20121206/85571_1 /TAXON_ID=71861 /ORGANISM="Scrippsiella trochoidea, Strain CCMP3099" /LENGTH=51 /DNA_ID=CAMNT_0002964719 /DNA_START=64 /DNA_END=217 /DNA_ORIENTATION=-
MTSASLPGPASEDNPNGSSRASGNPEASRPDPEEPEFSEVLALVVQVLETQ